MCRSVIYMDGCPGLKSGRVAEPRSPCRSMNIIDALLESPIMDVLHSIEIIPTLKQARDNKLLLRLLPLLSFPDSTTLYEQSD